MTDAEIVAAVRGGDTEAYSRLVERYRKAVYGLAYQRLGNAEDARDAAQEAFVRAFVHLGELREPARFAPWLRRIALNCCRMEGRRPTTAGEEAVAAAPHPDGLDVGRLAERVTVQAALGCLTEETRLALTLFYAGGYSHREIAAFLELPETAVKSRLRDARGRLRKELAAMADETLSGPPLADDFSERVMEVLRAAAAGDWNAVRRMVGRDPRLLDARDWFGNTPVTQALNGGHRELAEQLLDQGAAVSLWDTAAGGLLERVREALAREPERLDDFSPEGFTALHLAAHFGHAAVVEELLASGAAVDPVARNDLGVTPLHAALFGGRVEVARRLLEAGADPNLQRGGPGWPRSGWTALHYAAGRDLADFAGALLDHGADPGIRDAEGKTPLDVARKSGSANVIALLEPVPAET